jgi:Zn-dependent protease
MLWVAAAGPGSNFVMAALWAIIYHYSSLMPADFVMPLRLMAQAGILINVVLMVLNLFPLPPLDGGRIAVSLLPNHLAARYARIEPYGFIILLVLLFTGILSKIIGPFIYAFVGLITWLFV